MDLHNLIRSWYMILGDLSDADHRISFLMKSKGRMREASKGPDDAKDSMRLECLSTKVERLKRWAENYRDRTNIRINLVGLGPSQFE
jgi:hypothetical protein